MPGPAQPFPKGIGGNPTGRPKKTPEMREAEELARAASPDMVRGLIRIATEADDDNARIKAANSVLDRALGKPVQAVSGPDGGPIEVNDGGATLARDELARLVAGLAGKASGK